MYLVCSKCNHALSDNEVIQLRKDFKMLNKGRNPECIPFQPDCPYCPCEDECRCIKKPDSMGVFRWHAVMDDRTCGICRERHGNEV